MSNFANDTRGVARILHWGATEAERQRRENRGENRGASPLPNRLRGLGERRGSGVRGGAPAANAFWGPCTEHFWWREQSRLFPLKKIHSIDDWGAWLPCHLWIRPSFTKQNGIKNTKKTEANKYPVSMFTIVGWSTCRL